jgi:hypothetical protein
MPKGIGIGGLNMRLPSVRRETGQIGKNDNPDPTLPKISGAAAIGAKTPKSPVSSAKITNLDHLSGMHTGLQRRMAGPNSRLSAPKRPYVRRGKVS